ncbi:MAG TPA: hypothetical protein EYN82_01120 [Candidatus Marinimicrobia bacterium]|nr:hypothetical protein [Candidatus Neomarinimicrobiota bacterium]
MPYLLPDSSIIYPFRVQNPSMNAGGVGGGIQRITWDGSILWNYIFANATYQHHHDIEPLPGGNILIIVWESKTAQEAYDMGRQTIDNPLNVMWSEAILELNPFTGNIDWEWHLWDHLIQDVDSGLPNYGVVFEHPELFDINNGTAGSSGGPGGGQGPNGDWMHLNAINYNAELDQIVISSAKQNEILVIDHSTSTEEAAGHTGGNSGKGGDLLYRWGNPQNYDRGNNNDHILGHQHGVNWVHEGSPGAGNLILFNNHHNSNNSGAVIEIETPIDENGNYPFEDGEPWGPESFIMVYNNIYTQMQGGAFRQPNGNTLITDCDDAHIFEINVNGSTQWEYNPSGNYQIPRAQKYGLDYFDQTEEFVTMEISYSAGWNLVGLPLEVEDSSYEILFPESVDGTLYSFGAGYIQETELLVGTGYWLRFTDDGISTIAGFTVYDLEISLMEGWNLISGTTDPIDVNNIGDPGGIIIPETFYGFGGSYENVDILEPGESYWVRTSGAGVITFQGS